MKACVSRHCVVGCLEWELFTLCLCPRTQCVCVWHSVNVQQSYGDAFSWRLVFKVSCCNYLMSLSNPPHGCNKMFVIFNVWTSVTFQGIYPFHAGYWIYWLESLWYSLGIQMCQALFRSYVITKCQPQIISDLGREFLNLNWYPFDICRPLSLLILVICVCFFSRSVYLEVY